MLATRLAHRAFAEALKRIADHLTRKLTVNWAAVERGGRRNTGFAIKRSNINRATQKKQQTQEARERIVLDFPQKVSRFAEGQETYYIQDKSTREYGSRRKKLFACYGCSRIVR